MTDMNQEIANILELITQADGLKANAQRMVEQADQMKGALRVRISNGETTGDRMRDFIISRYGFLNEEIEAVHRDLEARMSGHVGEFILAITKEENFHGCTGFGYKPQDIDYILEEHFYLGVLKDSVLVLDLAKGTCALPTGNYAQWSSVRNGNVQLVERNITSGFTHDFGFCLNKQLAHRNPGRRLQKELDLELEVKVGDVEVMAWFEKRLERTVVFQKASHLLGRKIEVSLPMSIELKRQYKTIEMWLISLVEQRNRFKRRIANIYQATDRGVYSPDGVSITVCETEDDARVISMGPRKELVEVEIKLKRQLKIALEHGMVDDDSFPLVKQLCQEYGVGTS